MAVQLTKVRLSDELHFELKKAAIENERTLNAEIALRLERMGVIDKYFKSLERRLTGQIDDALSRYTNLFLRKTEETITKKLEDKIEAIARGKLAEMWPQQFASNEAH